MFAVYKIENNINHKVYIGSSIRVDKRWQQHKNTAFNPNSPQYNYPLYCAFRKYGIENFTFSIIGKDYMSIEEMQQDEFDWINYYNSVEKGYNQTYNTDSNHITHENCQKYREKISCPCAKVDRQENILEIYKSYQEASRLNGDKNNASKIRAVCKGIYSSINGLYFRDLDEDGKVIHKDFKPYRNRKTIVGIKISDPEEIIYFDSVLQASKKLSIDRQSVGKCIKGDKRYSYVGGYIWREVKNGEIIQNALDIDILIQNYDKANPLINGVRHSITEWCKIFNISRRSVYRRVYLENMDIITALTLKKRR